jgi:hypothetical protein
MGDRDKDIGRRDWESKAGQTTRRVEDTGIERARSSSSRNGREAKGTHTYSLAVSLWAIAPETASVAQADGSEL